MFATKPQACIPLKLYKFITFYERDSVLNLKIMNVLGICLKLTQLAAKVKR